MEVAVLRSRLEAADAALLLQNKEYERRLEELNHLHKNATIDRAQYVTRELHDQLNKELLERIERLRQEMAMFVCHREFDPIAAQVKINTEKFGEGLATLSTKNATIAAAIAAIIAIANLIFVIWHTLGGHVP